MGVRWGSVRKYNGFIMQNISTITLHWGGRGRWFKSSHSDQEKVLVFWLYKAKCGGFLLCIGSAFVLSFFSFSTVFLLQNHFSSLNFGSFSINSTVFLLKALKTAYRRCFRYYQCTANRYSHLFFGLVKHVGIYFC